MILFSNVNFKRDFLIKIQIERDLSLTNNNDYNCAWRERKPQKGLKMTM